MVDTSPYIVAVLLFGAVGALFLVAAVGSLLRIKFLRFGVRLVLALLFLALAGLSGAIAAGLSGYRALAREEIAARIMVQPIGPQRFAATFVIPDRPHETFDITGDAIYVDAHILKWKSTANLLGLHTVYELDRVAGRYDDIEQERSGERSVYSLGQPRAVDLFDLRRRHTLLAPLLDAEYGSGTFVPVKKPAEFELRVSTTGLLIREVKPAKD